MDGKVNRRYVDWNVIPSNEGKRKFITNIDGRRKKKTEATHSNKLLYFNAEDMAYQHGSLLNKVPTSFYYGLKTIKSSA